MTKAEKDFLIGLAKLTKETGIAIVGCGCCGSPYLTEVQEVPDEAGYIYKSPDDSSEVLWMSPEEWGWEKSRHLITREAMDG